MTGKTTEITSPAAIFCVLGAACALVPALAMWGFTVDDALIPVRYAHNVATGAGYRFDAHGASTDGVTPLPWVWGITPLAGGDALVTLVRVKAVGVLAWVLGGGALGARVGAVVAGLATWKRVLAAAGLLVMGIAFPIGAWAASGMETGVAAAIATLAATRVHRPRQAAAIAGIAAAFRPELVIWAVAIGMGASMIEAPGSTREAPGSRLQAPGAREGTRVARGMGIALGLAGAPFVICAVVRFVVFGRAAPLALLAKPSDPSHGGMYAAAAAIVVLTPILVVAPIALVKSRELAVARVIVVAFLAHVVAVIAAGGDWMPYARLMVPVAPSLLIAFTAIVVASSRWQWNAARLAAATFLGVLLVMRAAPAGRGVHADRMDLVRRARPVLEGAQVVAALDIGWVGAATDARIVDLAGLTDPAIAILPGGHTSKHVDVSMLLDRGVDTVILYSDLRVVEQRLLRADLFTSRFELAQTLPVGTRGATYAIYRRRRI